MNLLKSKPLLKLALCSIVLLGALSVKAELSEWTKPFVGPDQKISTLIVTGNYAKPRIIAELIQASTRQPILLLPANNQSGIYFMPPVKDGGKAMKIPNKEMTNFVNFIGAKQILILGDTNYVPQKYLDKIADTQTVCIIKARNWQKVANAIGKFLNLPNLPGDYNNLAAKMTNEVNYQRSETTTNDSVEQMLPTTNDIQPLPTIDDSADKAAIKETPENEPFVIDASQK